jgi:ABC-2 type transport system permease protein
MAVYEHTYKPYAGPLTTEWSRFLVIPRHAYRDVYRSKLFIAFFALCFVCPLIMAILIYLHHNLTAMAVFQINLRDLAPINAFFFRVFMGIQTSLAFLLTVLIGPPLISRDLANNALPLYLCRPFSRAEYVFG